MQNIFYCVNCGKFHFNLLNESSTYVLCPHCFKRNAINVQTKQSEYEKMSDVEKIKFKEMIKKEYTRENVKAKLEARLGAIPQDLDYHFHSVNWNSPAWSIKPDGIHVAQEIYSFIDISSIDTVYDALGHLQFFVYLKTGISKMLLVKKDQSDLAREAEKVVYDIIKPNSKKKAVNGQYIVLCNNCKKFYYFTEAQVEAEKRKENVGTLLDAIGAGIGGIGMLTGAIVGMNPVNAMVMQSNIDECTQRIDEAKNRRNFDACPHCGSLNTQYFDEETYKKCIEYICNL